MKERKPSRSAAAACALRAAESMRPENERVCYDPYARDFLRGMYSILVRSRLLTKIALWHFERKVPGIYGYIVARPKHIDGYLNACIDDRIEQLVILGAGYDSRAYRFNELKGKVKVFEVDHPATQRVKVDKVKKILGSLPDHVIYVPIDFDRDKLNNRLFESGYDKDLKTLFIWEGVTYYITAEAVDETLAFVASNSGEGSSIICDYTLDSVVDGTSELEEAEKWRRQAQRRGEPLTFGIEEGAVEGFLFRRGFHQVKDVGAEFLRSTYSAPLHPKRKVARQYRVVHATVKPRE